MKRKPGALLDAYNAKKKAQSTQSKDATKKISSIKKKLAVKGLI